MLETPIEEMAKEDLTDCLKVFYAAVKQKDGKDFKTSSPRTMRAAIERWFPNDRSDRKEK